MKKIEVWDYLEKEVNNIEIVLWFKQLQNVKIAFKDRKKKANGNKKFSVRS